MSNSYVFKGKGDEPLKAFGPLPAGDYSFVVTECGEPYTKNDKWIVKVKLTIQPHGLFVWAHPWSGETRDGEERDGIGEFLLAVNRAPSQGKEPDWDKVIGSRGKVRLKLEIAQEGKLAGKEVNAVAFFHRPKKVEVVAQSGQEGRKQEELDDLDMGPSEIPF